VSIAVGRAIFCPGAGMLADARNGSERRKQLMDFMGT